MGHLYFDYAAATPLDPRVAKAMQPSLKMHGNPSSLHTLGRAAVATLEKARVKIAQLLHAEKEEIIFTSGGTESINFALKGVAFARQQGHIITTQTEHAAVMETCKYLEMKGFRLTYLPVDKYGMVSVKALEKAIQRDTILISIHYVNNELGTIQPIPQLASLAQRRKILFHSDACQAGGLLLDVDKLKVDLLSLNGTKMGGPRGIGICYKRKKIIVEPLLHGGGQEQGWRSGIENVAAAVGIATALELVQKEKKQEERKALQLRRHFIQKLHRQCPDFVLNGHPTSTVPHLISLSFAGLEGESILKLLDQEGIFISTGSACHAHSIELSPVLKAIGLPEKTARGTIRISFGKNTPKKDLEVLIRKLVQVVAALRKGNV